MSYWVEPAVLAVCTSPECAVPVRRVEAEHELWRELGTCVLGSQVPHWMGLAAADRLDDAGLLAPTNRGVRVEEMVEALVRPLASSNGARRYRFPYLRARQLVAAHKAVREDPGSLAGLVLGCDPDESRRRLVASVPGAGLKQASLFLRNVGVSDKFAVLDVHVLRYMETIGLVRQIPRALTPEMYLVLESILSHYARGLGFTTGHVDRAIWAVMSSSAGR